MGKPLSFAIAGLVSVWAETMLYGVYSTIFFESLYITHKRKRRSSSSVKVFTIATILMYIIATLHVSIGLYRLLKGFVWLEGENAAAIYFSTFKGIWEHTLYTVLNLLMIWMGECLLVYRCYIIWGCNIWVVLPSILLFLAGVAVNVPVLVYWTKHGAVLGNPLRPALSSIYPLAFVQNLLATGLIAYRLVVQHYFSQNSGIRPNGSRLGLMNVVRIILESAMLYCVEFFVLIILYILKHPAQYIILSMVTPTIGIVFNMILVRLQFAIDDSNPLPPTMLNTVWISPNPQTINSDPETGGVNSIGPSASEHSAEGGKLKLSPLDELLRTSS
ncbi:hypothetical protein BDN72DRAFT_817940 [Pluteus cervinus]|uniref:Uncharacterized protein n=1 Tax=Pluteus cervinus TaxID=181527 RepID=A0ACD3AZU2_9AGAR|nr:hypothetical protein BDN72DRAFT_817940 [Pluteus cervinus]